MPAVKRIGIFGGSFNPVHLGHLLIAHAAKDALQLDEIIFVPCHQSADRKKLLPAKVRLRMLRATLKGVRGFSVNDVELRRGGVSRSIDTLIHLKAAKKKESRFFLLIGEDQARKFPTWKEPEKLSKLSKVCVIKRPGFRKSGLIHKKFHFRTLNIPQYEISSTEIRRRCTKNLPMGFFINSEVLSILKAYRDTL